MDQIARYNRRHSVAASVASLLAEDPDAFPVIMEAATLGMQGAIERANDRAFRADRAMLSALCLLDAKRVSPGLAAMLGGQIAEGAVGGSNVEQSMQRRFAQTPAQAAE